MTEPRQTRGRIPAPKAANDAATPYVGNPSVENPEANEGASADPAGTHSPVGAYVPREPPRLLPRVFCDFSDRIAVTIGEVEIFETYLADIIGGMIANDTDG